MAPELNLVHCRFGILNCSWRVLVNCFQHFYDYFNVTVPVSFVDALLVINLRTLQTHKLLTVKISY